VTATAIVLRVCSALFCMVMLKLATAHFGLTPDHGMRTFAAVGDTVLRPGMAIISILAAQGILIRALPWALIGIILIATAVFAPEQPGTRAAAGDSERNFNITLKRRNDRRRRARSALAVKHT